MAEKTLNQIVEDLASGYPDPDKAQVRQEFIAVIERLLPTLGRRALVIQKETGLASFEEVWEAMQGPAEGDFAVDWKDIEPVKVLYVASKYLNNSYFGTHITQIALERVAEAEA